MCVNVYVYLAVQRSPSAPDGFLHRQLAVSLLAGGRTVCSDHSQHRGGGIAADGVLRRRRPLEGLHQPLPFVCSRVARVPAEVGQQAPLQQDEDLIPFLGPGASR